MNVTVFKNKLPKIFISYIKNILKLVDKEEGSQKKIHYQVIKKDNL